MKAKLLVNLKISGQTIRSGKVYDDSIEEFPEYIKSNITNRKVVQLTEGVIREVKIEEIKKEVKPEKTESKPKLVRKH